MTYRQVIPSDFMNHPRLADLARQATRPPPAPPAPSAAAAGGGLDPTLGRAIEQLGDPTPRDRVGDSASDTNEPLFSYRTPEALLGNVPEPTVRLLRALDDAATEARDRTLALSKRIDDARDRAGSASIDVTAAIRAAGLAEVQTVQAAREMFGSDKWPVGFSEPMKAYVRRIVAEGERLAEAENDAKRLMEQLRQHNDRTAPIIALRQRLVEAARRLRLPARELDLPAIDAKKAEKTLAEARAEIAAARAEIEAIETVPPNEHEVLALATEAVRRYGAATGLAAAVKWNGRAISINEPLPGLASEDRRPLRPLALLCAVAPELAATAIAKVIGSVPDAPLVKDRPHLIAEARQRMHAAELRERAALRALGDPLELFRLDADPAITLMVEGAR